jgi:hypothetical protein
VTPETAPYELVLPVSADKAPFFSGAVQPGSAVTILEGTYSGTGPITTTFMLTLDGVDVTGDVVGGQYTIPAGTDGQVLVYSETASNGVSADVTQTVTWTISSWSPADLFLSGEDGFAVDLRDILSTSTLTGQFGMVPTVGDPVGSIPDFSENDKLAYVDEDTERPILRQNANGRLYLEFDSDDVFDVAPRLPTRLWTLWMVYDPTGGSQFITFLNASSPAPWGVVGQESSTSTALLPGIGVDSQTIWNDDTQFAGSTRGDVWTEVQAANLVIAELNTNTASWPTVGIGDYNELGAHGTPGGVYAWGAINRALTSGERSELQAYGDRLRGA